MEFLFCNASCWTDPDKSYPSIAAAPDADSPVDSSGVQIGGQNRNAVYWISGILWLAAVTVALAFVVQLSEGVNLCPSNCEHL